jgi:multicomponent Na+:H+ antiporter subunit C
MSRVGEILPILVGLWLLLAGLYGAATTRHLVHLVVCVSVLHSGAWLLLLGVGHRPGVTAPILDADTDDQVLTDPVVQALTVTDVVVGAAVTALLIALSFRVKRRFGVLDPHELHALRG